jgi:mono/diheme cytochrome c family protein
MGHPRLLIGGISLGLAAWAAVLWMQISPSTDLTRSQAPVAVRSVAIEAGNSPTALYATACASCHQSAGEGRFPVFPPLAGSPWVNGDPDRLVALTLHGISGPIDVNAVDYSGLMPGFAHLSDRELAEVLSYVRKSWGNEASRLTEADVSAVRMRTGDRRTPWTAAELRTGGEASP